MNHRTLLERLGTNVETGKALGYDPTTISHWRADGIPPHVWTLVARYARSKGIACYAEDLELGRPNSEAA